MSEAKDNSEPAFPRSGTSSCYSQDGMSLRDWFAGMAMQSLIIAGMNKRTSPIIEGGESLVTFGSLNGGGAPIPLSYDEEGDNETPAGSLAWDAYAIADGMLKERGK